MRELLSLLYKGEQQEINFPFILITIKSLNNLGFIISFFYYFCYFLHLNFVYFFF